MLRSVFAKTMCAVAGVLLAVTAMQSEVTPLREGWDVQSACKATQDGATISAAGFKPEGWLEATVPSTVVAVQVADGVIKDPFYGENLRSAPGMTTMTPPPQQERRRPPAADGAAVAPAGQARQAPVVVKNPDGSVASYPVGGNYANMPMPEDSPYHCGWWYRKSFTIPVTEKGKQQWLRFQGINYRADIWINGQLVADKTKIQGAFTTHELDVTKYVTAGKENVVAVETWAPTPDDLAISWADWSPLPPDKEMGLWGRVDRVVTGNVEVELPAVTTHFTDGSLKEADLTVLGDVVNGTDKPVKGLLTATLNGVSVQQNVDLAANERKSVVFSPEEYAKLKVQNPKVWWPWQMGAPNMETLTLRFTEGGKVSDEASVKFGIREVTDQLTDKGYRLYKVNGKNILVRGGGWAPDMMLRVDVPRLQEQFKMVKDMGLNTIRSEGKMESDEFLNLADENGVMVMIGWTCCDRWERWANWTDENHKVAIESLDSQILRMRPHPSILMWFNGSDNPPVPAVETQYLAEEKRLHWPNPTLSSATKKVTTVSGASGVKMEGPYDFVAPEYWEIDKSKYGGAYGFATEISPGPAIPTLAGMRKFIPESDIWPHDDTWRYHAGGGSFRDATVFNEAMDKSYGGANDPVTYDRIAQTMAYDGERSMFEAYKRNKYTSTGVIQWMLNNSWPSMIWHLYDYYFGIGGGYFGTKKADEPLHVQYSYDDHSIWVVNSTYKAASGLTATATVLDQNQAKLFSGSGTVQMGPDGTEKAISIPDSAFTNSSIYYIDLTLKNKAGEVIDRNFYWLPAKETVFNWQRTNYTHTPATTYEDMTALRNLPQAKVDASVHMVGDKAEVKLHNPSDKLAFQVALTTDPTSMTTETPVMWSDNYVELMPGETVLLSAVLPKAVLERGGAIHIKGWNIEEQTLHTAAAMTTAKK